MTASQVRNYSLIVCVSLAKYSRLFWLRNCKLCKLAKVSYTRVSYNSSNYFVRRVATSHSKPYLSFCVNPRPVTLHILVWITDRLRYNITQEHERVRLCFRMKAWFSDAFLVQVLQVLTLRLVSSFWPSGHLFLAMQFISLSESTWGGMDRPAKPKP